VAEVGAPGAPSRWEHVRLRTAAGPGAWFPWAWVGIDRVDGLAAESGLRTKEVWTDAGRWFVLLSRSNGGPG
jgi:hypothetical protein